MKTKTAPRQRIPLVAWHDVKWSVPLRPAQRAVDIWAPLPPAHFFRKPARFKLPRWQIRLACA